MPASPTRRPEGDLIPQGTAKPEEIPSEIFDAALTTFLELRRLDMQALAQELGIGRATLYRKVGDRDKLLGEVLWYLTRWAMTRALEAAEGLSGGDRVLAVVASFMRDVSEQPGLQRLLDAEPEASLRILTSKHGPVQRGIVEVLERLLAEEEEQGSLDPPIDRATLAYVIVRVGESFMYADVIADSEPNIALALDVVAQLLRNGNGS